MVDNVLSVVITKRYRYNIGHYICQGIRSNSLDWLEHWIFLRDFLSEAAIIIVKIYHSMNFGSSFCKTITRFLKRFFENEILGS